MRALAHPLRIELFERLAIEGTATASELAPLVGSTPSNCSFHLRTLAEAGFIERAPGHSGRERPWRVIDVTQNWDSRTEGNPELAEAATALNSSFREWEFERIRQASAHENPEPWRLHTSGVTMHLTPEEAYDLGHQIAELTRPFISRWHEPDERPEGSRPVRLYSTMYLVRPAPGESVPESDEA